MSAYSEYFLNSASEIIHYDTLEISHPNFTQTYYIIRNNPDENGVDLLLESGGSVVTFDYYPVKITPTSTSNDLDQSLKIELGDLGDILPAELDSVRAGDGFLTKPTVKYRAYRSDQVSASDPPLYGPWDLEVESFSFNSEGAIFEAKAPAVNINSVGEFYKLARFPMLRGFL